MDDYLTFDNREQFREWLNANSINNSGIWIIFTKKNGTLKASEALEEALCFGWIDGLIKSLDSNSYIKRFTPRTKNSSWSDKNKELVKKLEAQGLMTDMGRAAITQAVMNGQWDKVKTDISKTEIDHFISLIKNDDDAYKNLINMSESIKKTYAKHYFAAKGEATREKRLAQIIQRLQENKKPM